MLSSAWLSASRPVLMVIPRGRPVRQKRIDQRHLGVERLAGERVFLHPLGVPDGRPAGDLAAGAGRGRDRDDRRAAECVAVLAGLEEVLYAGEVAIGGGQHLGGVHDRAAAQSHDRLDRPRGSGVEAAGLRETDEVRVGPDIAHGSRRRSRHRLDAARQIGEHAAAVGVVIGDQAIGAAAQHLAHGLEHAGAEPDIDRIAIAPHARVSPNDLASLWTILRRALTLIKFNV